MIGESIVMSASGLADYGTLKSAATALNTPAMVNCPGPMQNHLHGDGQGRKVAKKLPAQCVVAARVFFADVQFRVDALRAAR